MSVFCNQKVSLLQTVFTARSFWAAIGLLLSSCFTASAQTSCVTAWSANQIYTGGRQVSLNGVDSTAANSNLGENPATNNGPAGAGGPWVSDGRCGEERTRPRIFAPYQDMSLTGISAGVVQNDLPALSRASGIKHFSMAFISSAGNACNPEWGGVGPISSDTTFTKGIRELRERGGDVIISFGGFLADTTVADGGGPDFELGYGGGCTTVESLQAAYQAVIDKYSIDSDRPVALDFDIETDAIDFPILDGVNTIDLRNQALAALAKANPGLNISFTVPIAETGFLQPEIDLLKSAIKFKVPVAVVNVLPFDFGAPIAPGQFGSVVTTAAADALEQMRFLGMKSALGITVLIGTNDESDETFLLSDARIVEEFAEKEKRVQRLSIFEVSRDNGSCGNNPADLDDNNCSSIVQRDFAFSHIFEDFQREIFH